MIAYHAARDLVTEVVDDLVGTLQVRRSRLTVRDPSLVIEKSEERFFDSGQNTGLCLYQPQRVGVRFLVSGLIDVDLLAVMFPTLR